MTAVGGTTYTYDNNGNVTAIGSLDYTWDWRNRLASAERSGGGITTYGYDHTGQRVFKATGTATTSYPNKYYNLATTTGAATTTKHIFAPDGTLLATVVGASTTATTTYLHPDHLGGTNVTTDEDGEVTQTLDYYPYGSQRIATGSFSEQRRFIGEEFDPDTDFSYLNARYYQGSRGQFMSQDPVFWEVGQTKDGKAVLKNPQSLNSYSYANGNPIVSKDPAGRAAYLAARPVWVPGIYHLYYYVSPESSSRFANVGPFTLGGGPEGTLSWGNLQANFGVGDSSNDLEAGLPENSNLYVKLTPAEGQSEDDLIEGLYRGHVAVGNSSNKYRARGNQSGQSNANSNNYARTLAQYGSVLGQFNSFASKILAPGSDKSVPLGSASSLGVGNSMGNFVGTYNFGPGIGTYNFGSQSWVAPSSKK